jgi:hypothetical protein
MEKPITIQEISWLVASVVGAVAAIKAIYEIAQNREQRKKELRWKKANVAKELLDEIFAHDYSKSAILIMDSTKFIRKYKIDENEYEEISYDDVKELLNESSSNPGKKAIYIKDCFDWFFYFIDRIEHYIRIKLIDFEDVKVPLNRYSRIIEDDKLIFETYITDQQCFLALKFWQRFGQLPKNRWTRFVEFIRKELSRSDSRI